MRYFQHSNRFTNTPSIAMEKSMLNKLAIAGVPRMDGGCATYGPGAAPQCDELEKF
jgi:hypothetical protein